MSDEDVPKKKKKEKKHKSPWKEAQDPATGKTYWYNRETKKSTWTDPTGGEGADGGGDEDKAAKKKKKKEAAEEDGGEEDDGAAKKKKKKSKKAVEEEDEEKASSKKSKKKSKKKEAPSANASVADLCAYIQDADDGDINGLVAKMAEMKLSDVLPDVAAAKPYERLLTVLYNSSDGELLVSTSRLLAKLSNDEKAAKAMAKICEYRELIAAMRKHINLEDFLKFSIYLCGSLGASDDTYKKTIGIEGGLQVICQVLGLYSENAPLVDNCFYATNNLSEDHAGNCSFIVACRGIPIIFSSMLKHPEETMLLEGAVNTLINLASANDSNKDLIMKQQGSHAIAEVIVKNMDEENEDLITACLNCIGALCNDKYNKKVIKSGSVEAIVKAITTFKGSKDLVELAVKILTNLAVDPDEENMAIMCQEGAVKAVTEALATWRKDRDLEVLLLGCLTNLARNPINREQMVQNGAMTAVIGCMTDYSADDPVVEKSTKYMSLLAACDGEFDNMLAAGVIPALILALKKHAKSEPIQANGMGAIATLCYDERCAKKIAKEGVTALILDTCKEAEEDPAILTHSFTGLAALCQHATTASSMAANALAIAATALKDHGQVHKNMTIAVFQFLTNLSAHEQAASLIPETAAIKFAVKALNKWVDEVDVVNKGLHALDNMALHSGDVRSTLKAEGSLECIKQIEKKHVLDDDLMRFCAEVKTTINRRDIEEAGNVAVAKPKKLKEQEGEEEKKEEKAKKLTKAQKNFLQAGSLMKRHFTSGSPSVRHVYIDQDLKHLCIKDPKKEQDPKNMIKIFQIKSIDKGRVTPALQKKKMMSSKFLLPEEICFSVQKGGSTIDLEAKDEETCNKFVDYLKLLVDVTMDKKKANKDAIMVFSAKLNLT